MHQATLTTSAMSQCNASRPTVSRVLFCELVIFPFARVMLKETK